MMRQRILTRCSRTLTLALLVCGMCVLPGCLTGEEFRAVAGPSVQSGVTSIVNGVLDGLFAVIEPETTTDSTGGA